MTRASLLLLAACSGSKPGDTAETALPPWPDAPTACEDAIRVPVDGGPTVGDGGEADPSEAVLGASPEPTQVWLGFPHDPATTAGFTWQTDADTLASEVELSDGVHAPVRLSGASFELPADLDPDDGVTVRLHEVHLCGLSPDTAYSARVGGEGAWSEPHAFRTAPDEGPVRIAISGDNNLGYAEWAVIAEGMLAWEPDLFVHTGDVLHDGHSSAEWAAWFEAAEGLAGSVPTVVAQGNHEERAALYFGHILQPDNETWFGFDWGPAHFAVLDSEQEDAVRAGEEAAFLADDLAGTAAPWAFATWHRPPWASGDEDGGNTAIRGEWGPVLDEHAASAVFNGHWHYYERTVPIVGESEAPSTAEGVTYVITGGGGALPTACGEDAWFSAVCEVAYHFVILDVDDAGATLTAVGDDGEILDSLELEPRAR